MIRPALTSMAFASAALAVTMIAAPTAAAQAVGQPSNYQAGVETFEESEVINAAADFLGVTAEAAAGALERIFSDLGRPVGYVAGEEGGGAIGVGLRYGEGFLT